MVCLDPTGAPSKDNKSTNNNNMVQEERPRLQSNSRFDMAGARSSSPEGFMQLKVSDDSHSNLQFTAEQALDTTAGKEVLYEREAQERQLQEVYGRLRSGPPEAAELCLITGCSGTGKSRLALSLKQHVVQDGGLFISAKFDQFQLQSPTRPFATLDDAFQELVQLIMLLPQDQRQSIRESAKRAVGSESSLLVETLPSLKSLLRQPVAPATNRKSSSTGSLGNLKEDPESRVVPGDTQKRLSNVFRRFVQALASTSRPLVVFLDDLQWACPGSLNLLHGVLQKEDRQENVQGGLLILGTCRGNEVAFSDSLSVMLRDLEDGGRKISEVTVGNLSPAALCKMIADRLKLETFTAELKELAALVHHKTQGNVMFVLQYLRSLQEDGLLFKEGGSWRWQTTEIQRLIIAESSDEDPTSLSLVSHLEKKLQRLPLSTQEVLKAASCLGAEFDGTLLRMAATVSQEQLEQALADASELGCLTYNTETQTGNFTHDKFLEAAYALIPNEERSKFHHRIAKNVAEQAPADISTNLLFIVNHALRGSDSIELDACRRRLAQMCLDAGRRTAKSSAFSSALMYFEAGIKELQNDLWQGEQYQLSLHLHNAAAEVAFCVGEHEKVATFLDAIKKNARQFEDRIQAYSTQILSLTAAERELRLEACAVGIDVLNRLGEKFPKKVGSVGTLLDFMKTKGALRKVTDEDILNLPLMTDKKALGIMTILHQLYACFLRTDFTLAPLVGFRMCRLTMRKGLSPLSSLGFGFYASVLSRIGMADDAVRFGHLALVLMEKYPCSGLACDTACTVWADSLPHSIAYGRCIEPIQESFSLGMMTGSIASAMIAGFVDCSLIFSVGQPLQLLSEKVVMYKNKCSEYNHSMMVPFFDVLLQGCHNFQGKWAKSPLLLTGPVIEENALIEAASKEKMCSGLLWVYMMKYTLAVYFDEFEKAEALSAQISKNIDAVVLPFLATIHNFLESFTAAILSPKSRKYRSQARSKLKCLKAAAKMNPDSLNNKVALVEAEIARAAGKFGKAASLYCKSIELASNEGYLHEEALACERAGKMFLKQGKLIEARKYLVSSRDLYAQWGSKPKSEQVDTLMASTEDLAPCDEVVSVEPTYVGDVVRPTNRTPSPCR